MRYQGSHQGSLRSGHEHVCCCPSLEWSLRVAFAQAYPESLALEIEWLVHPLSILMNDLKANVKAAAKDAMIAVANCTGNRDLEKFGGTIVKAQENVKNVQGCVEELAGCIFVQM